jgi:hypothetical protein
MPDQISITNELTKLADLRDRGALSDSEFQTQKQFVLGHPQQGPEAPTQVLGPATTYAYDPNRIARWRPWIEVVGLLVVIGELVNVVGLILAAVDVHQNGWQRVASLGATVDMLDIAVVGAALLMIVGMRALFRWPPETSTAVGKTGLGLLTLLIVWFVTTCVLSVLASTAGNHSASTLNFDNLSIVAAVFVNLGIAVAAVGLFVAVTYAWRLFAAPRPSPLVLPPSAG